MNKKADLTVLMMKFRGILFLFMTSMTIYLCRAFKSQQRTTSSLSKWTLGTQLHSLKMISPRVSLALLQNNQKGNQNNIMQPYRHRSFSTALDATTVDTPAKDVTAKPFTDITTSDAKPEKFKSEFLQTLLERGFINQCTDYAGLDEKFSQGTVSAYLGFDATATSLHVGSLLQIMILRTLQKCGHRPVILLGGGTTRVGDPSGKDESRQLLTDEIINQNAASLSAVFQKFIKFGSGKSDAIMVNNADWLNTINYLDFLRDYGRHFTINRMLTFDSVKQRLAREQPLTFLEFNYMLLQAYDFVELSRRYGVSLQLGGSDQWGNIVSGVELGRKVDQAQLFGLTAPLLTTSDGKKMGKTASGAIWLNKDLLSEYDYWQFWRNTADADVIRFLKIFTELPIEEIRKMESWEGAQLNEAKIILADEATKLLHGSDCLNSIHETVKSLFSTGGSSNYDSLPRIKLSDTLITQIESGNGVSVVDAMLAASLATSKTEARKAIINGGARINDEKVSSEAAVFTKSDFDESGRMKLSLGKKRHVLIVMA